MHRFLSLLIYSHPSQEQLIERSDTLLCFYFYAFGPQFLFSFYECQHRPLAPSCGMSFCCLSDPTGHISPGPATQREKGRKEVSKKYKYIQIEQKTEKNLHTLLFKSLESPAIKACLCSVRCLRGLLLLLFCMKSPFYIACLRRECRGIILPCHSV